MITAYIHRLLSQASYTKEESGMIIASVTGYQGFYSQGENFEEARQNLQDAIEGVITIKVSQGDKKMANDIQSFVSQNLQYA